MSQVQASVQPMFTNKQRAGSSPRITVNFSFSTFHVASSQLLSFSLWSPPSWAVSIEPYVLSQASMWPCIHWHISPLSRWGAHVLFPRSLKGLASPSTILSHYCCCLVGKGLTVLHAGKLLGSPRCPLPFPPPRELSWRSTSYSSCCWSSSRSPEVSPKMATLVLHFILFRSRIMCSSLVSSQYRCLRPCHVVKMAKKSSRVSHTSSQMVRTCCWCSPSAGLRPPPQLTSNW